MVLQGPMALRSCGRPTLEYEATARYRPKSARDDCPKQAHGNNLTEQRGFRCQAVGSRTVAKRPPGVAHLIGSKFRSRVSRKKGPPLIRRIYVSK
jgi:hypothetical protein